MFLKMTASPLFKINHGAYLVGALAHGVYQFLDDHVHTLDTGLLQFYDLLLYNGFKRHVGCEKSSPDVQEEEIQGATVESY